MVCSLSMVHLCENPYCFRLSAVETPLPCSSSAGSLLNGCNSTIAVYTTHFSKPPRVVPQPRMVESLRGECGSATWIQSVRRQNLAEQAKPPARCVKWECRAEESALRSHQMRWRGKARQSGAQNMEWNPASSISVRAVGAVVGINLLNTKTVLN